MSWSYSSLPTITLLACSGTALAFFFKIKNTTMSVLLNMPLGKSKKLRGIRIKIKIEWDTLPLIYAYDINLFLESANITRKGNFFLML
jgi:hypothetical protein